MVLLPWRFEDTMSCTLSQLGQQTALSEMEVAPRYTLFTLLTLGSFLLVGRMDGTDHTPYTVTTPRALVVLTGWHKVRELTNRVH